VKRARFTKQARAELLEQIAYYEAAERGLGARFRGEVEAVSTRAAMFPKHGRPSAAGTRRRKVIDFKFSVIYTETDYGVLVHAVASHHRAPDYWVGRIRDA
jgi:plasmid stabilization system protein ParE